MKYSQSIVLGCIGAATLASAIPAGHFAPKHGHNGVQHQAPEATNLQERSYDDDLIFLRDFFDDLNTRAFEGDDVEARSLLSAAAKVATKSVAKAAPKVAAKAGGVAKTAAKAGSTAGKTVGKTAPKVNSALHKLPTSNKRPLAGGKTGLTKPHASAHTAVKPGHAAAKPGHAAAKPGHAAVKPGQKLPAGSKTHAQTTAGKRPLAGGKTGPTKPHAGAHTAVKPGHSALKLPGHVAGAKTLAQITAGKKLGAHNTLIKKPAGAKPVGGRLNTLKPNGAKTKTLKPNAVKKPTDAQLLSESRKQHTTDERNLANSRKQHTTDERNLANSRKQHATDVANQNRLQGQFKSERQRVQALEKQSEMWKNRAEGARAASYGAYAAPYYRPAPYNWRRDIVDEADLFERDLDLVDEIDARDLDWVDEIDAREFDMFDEVDARDFDEEDLEMRSIEDFEIDELD